LGRPILAFLMNPSSRWIVVSEGPLSLKIIMYSVAANRFHSTPI
jgi:hypothetical protein